MTLPIPPPPLLALRAVDVVRHTPGGDHAWLMPDSGVLVVDPGLDAVEVQWVAAVAAELATIQEPDFAQMPTVTAAALKLATVRAARQHVDLGRLADAMRRHSSGMAIAAAVGVPYAAVLARLRFLTTADQQALQDAPPLSHAPRQGDYLAFSVRVVFDADHPDMLHDDCQAK